jgi:hypothetical protein
MPNDFLSEEYAVTVDYGSSIANLISRYGYTLTNQQPHGRAGGV